MKVLVIWDWCGAEPVDLWSATGEMAELAMQCHGQYVNSMETPEDAAVYRLQEELKESSNSLVKLAATLEGYPLQADSAYDAIVVCGFVP